MTKVKICGLRGPRDVAAANRCLPDYVGFVFAKGSRRELSFQEARRLKEALDPRIQTVGVFVNGDMEEIVRLCGDGTLDAVQLHGEEEEAYLRALRVRIQQPIIRAVPVGGGVPVLPRAADYPLFDTATRERGGSGKTFDWRLLEEISVPYFLAGGLRPDNVADAVGRLHPYCVDVSSGVEGADGYKDGQAMEAFIDAVRRT